MHDDEALVFRNSVKSYLENFFTGMLVFAKLATPVALFKPSTNDCYIEKQQHLAAGEGELHVCLIMVYLNFSFPTQQGNCKI